jgi:hypothetical protein
MTFKLSKGVSRATLVCGTLDIAYALITTKLKGGSATGVLKFVAEGPFGKMAPASPAAAAALGLAVHFAIMALMVAFYAVAIRSPRLAGRSPWLGGTIYGIFLYGVMYWVVLPLRWPSIFPQASLLNIIEALFAHVVLVGLPLAHIIYRSSGVQTKLPA